MKTTRDVSPGAAPALSRRDRRKPFGHFALLLAAFLTLLWQAGDAAALDSELQLSQAGHTAWRIRDGYFGGVVYSLAQTPDGFLWIGTDAGLYRFDGVHFSEWRPPAGQALPDPRIIRLVVASDGGLWIGTVDGLARWHQDRLTVLAGEGRFAAIAEDRYGTVWAGRTRVQPPLCRFGSGAFDCLPAPPELGAFVGALFEDRQGRLWMGGERGVCGAPEGSPKGSPKGSPEPAAFECRPIESLRIQSGLYGVFALAEDAEGHLLADTGLSGLFRYGDAGWRPFEGTAPSPLRAASLLLDSRQSLYVGTSERGLLRLLPGRKEAFAPADGLSGDLVNDLLEDREGNLWVATSGGLDRFRDLKIATFTTREGLEGIVASVAAAEAGGVWVAGTRLLRLASDGKVAAENEAEAGLPGKRKTSLLEDSRGRLWLGLDDGLWRREEGGGFAEIRLPGGEKTGIVRALVEDRDGDVWAGVLSPSFALLRISDREVVERHSPEQLGAKGVSALAADPRGGVWVGLRGGDLVRWRAGAEVSRLPLGVEIHSLEPGSGGVWVASNQGLLFSREGRVARLDAAQGLPCEDLASVLSAPDGGLWIKATCGLIGVAAAEVAAWLEDGERKVEVGLRDARDGALAGRSAFSPSSVRAADGRLYFVLQEGGIQVFDPARESVNRVPPPVSILRLAADGKEYPAQSGRRLPALTRDVEIAYAALSFTDPDKVRFRYRLAGSGDESWREVGNRREAYFSNLGPGSYRFEVRACNNDGVWNEEGAALELAILPAFHQTGLFRTWVLLALFAAGWGLYRWRVHAFKTGLGRRAEERLAERTLIARELHDTLLQGVLSSSMHLHVALAQLPREAPVEPSLRRAQQILAQVGEEGRDVLAGLRSSDRGADDLEAALRRVPGELAEANGEIRFEVKAAGAARPLRPIVRDDVYRIAREALMNAFRHAGARAIEVEIEYAVRELRLAVSDDGCGIGDELLRTGREKHWGLVGMRERASRMGASLAVDSRNGHGTRVELRVPGAIAYEEESPRLAARLERLWRRLRAPRPSAPEEGTSR